MGRGRAEGDLTVCTCSVRESAEGELCVLGRGSAEGEPTVCVCVGSAGV